MLDVETRAPPKLAVTPGPETVLVSPVCQLADNVPPRERLRTGNRVLDAVVTAFTGKALVGQEPFWELRGVAKATLNLVFLAAAWVGTISLMLLADGGGAAVGLLPFAAVGVVNVVGRLRAMQVEVGHHAIHGEIAQHQKSWVNTVWAHLATVLPIAQNPADYREDHVKFHHRMRHFTTLLDPDAKFLHELGFRQGMTRAKLYRALWRTIVSPRFHWLFIKARVRSALGTATPVHRFCVLLWLAALVGVATLLPPWITVAAIVLPLGPLYHVSALLQFLTEHRWLTTTEGPTDRHDYASRCVGRFALVPPPAPGLTGTRKLLAWSGWMVRMLPEVLVIRSGVWVGDMPAHDQHHLAHTLGQDARAWPEAIYDRQKAIDAGDLLGLGSREVYGIKAALDWVFKGYANTKV